MLSRVRLCPHNMKKMSKKKREQDDLSCRIGNRVRELRTAQGIPSQEELGELAGLHRTFIGRVERGETNITIDSLARILRALSVTLSEFFAPFTDH